jgi:hypothetical protein
MAWGAAAVVLALLGVLAVLGLRAHLFGIGLSDFAKAVAAAPADAERLSWTDWDGVRRELGSDVGARSDPDEVRQFLDDAFDRDLTSRSALVQSAPVLQTDFGFSPASAASELFSQGRDGAAITLRMPDGTDFGEIADRLESLGYGRPDSATGVWAGGPDLLPTIGADLTPELAYLVLDEDEGLVVASDQAEYAETAHDAATGDGERVQGLDAVAEALDAPLSAAVYTGEYACGPSPWARPTRVTRPRPTGSSRPQVRSTPISPSPWGYAAGARYGWPWSSPTTTRPAPTPTVAPCSRPVRPSARVVTSPTGSRSAPPPPTAAWSAST